MKFIYIPIQESDGKWKMVLKLTPQQRRDADKARRRILNIKDDPDDWPWDALGSPMQVPLMYGNMLTQSPRLSVIISGMTGV